jgi:methionyl-tRNA formyltransferase
MDFCFLGNSHFSVIVLKTLLEQNFIPQLIITTSPKPIGRKQEITPNEVDTFAQEHNIKVLYGDHLKDEDFINELKKEKIDCAILASFGKILPRHIIKIFPHGIINVHPSLLPKYRGPSPIQTALLNGDTETGTTLFIIDEGIDNGPIIGQMHQEIEIQDNFNSLSEKLAILGGKLIINLGPQYIEGKVFVKPQKDHEATFTNKFHREDGKIDWNNPSNQIHNQIRALSNEPGTYCFFDKEGEQQILKIHEANIIKLEDTSDFSKIKPGSIINHENHFLITTSDGLIDLLFVQPEGKNIMSGIAFLNGNKISELC